MGILGVGGDVGVEQLMEKRPVTTWRWSLRSQKVQGRQGQRFWNGVFYLMMTEPGKGFREDYSEVKKEFYVDLNT